MKITKKPKKVNVYHQKMTIYNDKYECPSCKAHFNNFGITENIKRFECQCGQELIAEHLKEK